MSLTFFLNVSLFFAWIPLGLITYSIRTNRPLALKLSVFSVISFFLCSYFLYVEFIWSRQVINPIRLDLLFLIPILSIFYFFTGFYFLKIWKQLKSKAVITACLLLILISASNLGFFASNFLKIQSDANKIQTIPSLLFEAQFKNQNNFSKFFGSIDASENPIAGHFQAAPNEWATRMIINSKGHLWLYFHCSSNTECIRGEAKIPLSQRNFPATIDLHSLGGSQEEGQFSDIQADRFTFTLWVILNGQKKPYVKPATFVRTPPPFRQKSPGSKEDVIYSGAFSQFKITDKYIEPVQLWLWQSGDRFLGYYVRQNFGCGTENNFITPIQLEGTLKDNELVLKNSNSIEKVILTKISDSHLEGQILYNGKFLQSLSLKSGAILFSDRHDLAPLLKFEETKHWLETVSMGYMLTWKADCKVTPTE
ncbi:MAG: hypothetical protein JNM24_00045 [Bdellovibrionaceae bacterium]|nr:hypothetical protein [Pseudobdellovibrionaceae bacterium]